MSSTRMSIDRVLPIPPGLFPNDVASPSSHVFNDAIRSPISGTHQRGLGSPMVSQFPPHVIDSVVSSSSARDKDIHRQPSDTSSFSFPARSTLPNLPSGNSKMNGTIDQRRPLPPCAALPSPVPLSGRPVSSNMYSTVRRSPPSKPNISGSCSRSPSPTMDNDNGVSSIPKPPTSNVGHERTISTTSFKQPESPIRLPRRRQASEGSGGSIKSSPSSQDIKRTNTMTEQLHPEQHQQQQQQQQFCLCQPDRKIPRPRNSFILFRQHSQPAILTQKPGLSNPEISKIIGNQWRLLPSEAKQEWKDLAEEEKVLHQQRFPNYRYQPRRFTRSGPLAYSPSAPTGPNVVPSGGPVCTRCGGRIMNSNGAPPSPPRTPFSPNDPNTDSSLQQQQQQQHHHHQHQQQGQGEGSQPQQQPSSQFLQPSSSFKPASSSLSPPKRPHKDETDQFNGSESRLKSKKPIRLQINTANRNPSEHASITSAAPLGLKRRRIDGPRASSFYSPPNTPNGVESVNLLAAKQAAFAPRSSVTLPPLRQAIMVPPSPSVARVGQFQTHEQHHQESRQASHHQLQHQQQQQQQHLQRQTQMQIQTQTQTQKSEHVRPSSMPLQTTSSPSDTPMPKQSSISRIPFLTKIRLLSVVAPPVGISARSYPQSHYSHENSKNCALVAVDGENARAVQLMMKHLYHLFARDGHQIVKVFEGPNIPMPSDSSSAEETGLSSQDRKQKDDKSLSSRLDLTTQYFDVISKWHRVSRDIVSFLHGECSDGANENFVMEGDASQDNMTQQRQAKPFRIALVPQYQLTTVNKYAAAAPIGDLYGPVEHWQWMASLWRFCAGPDVTVYVRDCPAEEFAEANLNGALQGQGVSHPIDVWLERQGVIVVRRPDEACAVNDIGYGQGEIIEEKALRRVSFEVQEFLRK